MFVTRATHGYLVVWSRNDMRIYRSDFDGAFMSNALRLLTATLPKFCDSDSPLPQDMLRCTSEVTDAWLEVYRGVAKVLKDAEEFTGWREEGKQQCSVRAHQCMLAKPVLNRSTQSTLLLE